MGAPLHMQLVNHPASSSATALCVGVWLWLLQRGVSPAAVGLSYQRFVADRQWWRAIASQICHFELMHLVLNVSTLWGLAALAEPADAAKGGLGPFLEYLRVSLLLLLTCAAVCVAVHHVAVAVLGLERLRHTLMVGYSGVLFGWMALIAWRSAGHGAQFRLLGLASVPAAAAPFLLLLVTQVLLPNASFLGHLSGILAGLLLASGCLDWLTPYWTACLISWVAIGICYGLALEGRLGTSYVRLLPYVNDSIIEDGSETARLADLMERGGTSVSGPGAGMTAAAAGGLTGTVRRVRAAAAAAAAAGQMVMSWFGIPQRRLLGASDGREVSRTVAAGQSAASTSAAAAATAATAALLPGPALPWGSPAIAAASVARPTAAAGGSFPGRA